MGRRVSERPEDVTSWGEILRLRGAERDRGGYTYPKLARLRDEDDRLYLFRRGPGFREEFLTSGDGDTWSTPQALLDNDDKRPYVVLTTDGEGAIHLAFTVGHPEESTSHHLHYACYRDGAFWRADGTRIAGLDELPLGTAEVDLVSAADRIGPTWPWEIALDGAGRPVIVYVAFPSWEDHRYRYVRWTGSEWDDHEITSAGRWFPSAPEASRLFQPCYSGGVALDPEDPSTVFLSRQDGGVFEIERWTTTDGGNTWVSRPVTRGSKENNVRPVVPRGRSEGGPELVWMQGAYDDFKRYKTGIRMK
jgi:hypothetical protein